MKARSIIIILLSISIPGFIFSAFINGGGGGFYLGYNFLEVNALNDDITSGGYNALPDKRITFGGGGYSILWKGLLLGGEGGGILPLKSESQNYNLKIIGGYGLFDVGFAVIRRSNFLLYPMIGIGHYMLVMDITPKNGDFDFEDFIYNPQRMTSLDCNGFMMTFQGGFDYIINFSNDPSAVGGLLLGFRAGYMYPLGDATWKLGDIELNNAPGSPFKGFFFNFIIGGFGGQLQ